MCNIHPPHRVVCRAGCIHCAQLHGPALALNGREQGELWRLFAKEFGTHWQIGVVFELQHCHRWSQPFIYLVFACVRCAHVNSSSAICCCYYLPLSSCHSFGRHWSTISQKADRAITCTFIYFSLPSTSSHPCFCVLRLCVRVSAFHCISISCGLIHNTICNLNLNIYFLNWHCWPCVVVVSLLANFENIRLNFRFECCSLAFVSYALIEFWKCNNNNHGHGTTYRWMCSAHNDWISIDHVRMISESMALFSPRLIHFYLAPRPSIHLHHNVDDASHLQPVSSLTDAKFHRFGWRDPSWLGALEPLMPWPSISFTHHTAIKSKNLSPPPNLRRPESLYSICYF